MSARNIGHLQEKLTKTKIQGSPALTWLVTFEDPNQIGKNNISYSFAAMEAIMRSEKKELIKKICYSDPKLASDPIEMGDQPAIKSYVKNHKDKRKAIGTIFCTVTYCNDAINLLVNDNECHSFFLPLMGEKDSDYLGFLSKKLNVRRSLEQADLLKLFKSLKEKHELIFDQLKTMLTQDRVISVYNIVDQSSDLKSLDKCILDSSFSRQAKSVKRKEEKEHKKEDEGFSIDSIEEGIKKSFSSSNEKINFFVRSLEHVSEEYSEPGCLDHKVISIVSSLIKKSLSSSNISNKQLRDCLLQGRVFGLPFLTWFLTFAEDNKTKQNQVLSRIERIEAMFPARHGSIIGKLHGSEAILLDEKTPYKWYLINHEDKRKATKKVFSSCAVSFPTAFGEIMDDEECY